VNIDTNTAINRRLGDPFGTKCHWRTGAGPSILNERTAGNDVLLEEQIEQIMNQSAKLRASLPCHMNTYPRLDKPYAGLSSMNSSNKSGGDR
jgi:hypothetical protein